MRRDEASVSCGTLADPGVPIPRGATLAPRSTTADWAAARAGVVRMPHGEVVRVTTIRRARMAHARLDGGRTIAAIDPPDSQDRRTLLRALRRLYAQLQDLPPQEKPSASLRQASDRYLALEARIHAVAKQYQGLG